MVNSYRQWKISFIPQLVGLKKSNSLTEFPWQVYAQCHAGSFESCLGDAAVGKTHDHATSDEQVSSHCC